MKMPFCSFEANFALVPIEIKPSLAGGWLFEFRGPYERTIPIVCSMVTSRYACQNSYRSKGPSGTVFCPPELGCAYTHAPNPSVVNTLNTNSSQKVEMKRNK